MNLEVTRVAGSLMVVVLGEDGVVEGVLQEDIDMPLISQDMIVELPV